MQRYYRVWPRDDDQGEAYWVFASSGEEARRLIASNAGAAARDAENPGKFECEIDAQKTPPWDFIHRRLYGPIAIMER